MGALLKTRSILTHDVRFPDDEGGRQWFIQSDEETGVVNRRVYVDSTTFEDLGQPEVITLTVEPGDQLNDNA